MFDGQKFGEEMVAIIRGYVEAELQPLVSRIEALERRGEEIERSVTRLGAR